MPTPWDKEIAEVQRRNAERKAGVTEGMRLAVLSRGRRAKRQMRWMWVIHTVICFSAGYVAGMFGPWS